MSRAEDSRTPATQARRRPRVAIAYHHIAHYRRAIFQQLVDSERYEYVVIADPKPTEDSIAVVDPEIGWPWVRTPNLLIGPFLWQRGLVREVLRGDYDAFILLGSYRFLSMWVAAAAARLRGKPVYFWSHGWTRERAGIEGRVINSFYRLAKGLLVYGHWAKCMGIAYGFSADSIYVVYNSLDYAAQRAARERVAPGRGAEIRRELFGDPEVPAVICSARLIPERRLDLLFDALGHLAARGIRMNLLLVGDGPIRDQLERSVVERGLPVHFYGACYDEERLAELTRAARLTVMPGPIGLTAIQSLAFGTPVLTHDDREQHNPEWEAIVPGRTGAFFRRDDAEDLARALAEWADGAETADDVRERCYEIIDRFYTPEAQVRVIERALDGLPADDLAMCGERRKA